MNSLPVSPEKEVVNSKHAIFLFPHFGAGGGGWEAEFKIKLCFAFNVVS